MVVHFGIAPSGKSLTNSRTGACFLISAAFSNVSHEWKSCSFISLESGPSLEQCMKQSMCARFHGWVQPTSAFSSSMIRKGNTYMHHQAPANINKNNPYFRIMTVTNLKFRFISSSFSCISVIFQTTVTFCDLMTLCDLIIQLICTVIFDFYRGDVMRSLL